MHYINQKALALYVRFVAVSDEHGQGALEYIGMVIGLAIMVAIGFQIAGTNIFEEASTFVSRVLDAASGG